jgi:hypothetical protein
MCAVAGSHSAGNKRMGMLFEGGEKFTYDLTQGIHKNIGLIVINTIFN